MRRKLRKTAAPFSRSDKGSKRIACAHLTPFFHAKKHGYQRFWNIDADDTTLLLSAEKAAEALRRTEDLVREKEMAACSLDMWFTKTKRLHWSLGVLLIDTAKTDFCELFAAQKDKTWVNTLRLAELNLDWYLTYLKYQKGIKIETFYIENCCFIHWGNFIETPMYAWINYWKDGKMYFPLHEALRIGEMAVFELKDVYPVSVGATLEEGFDYYRNDCTAIPKLSDIAKELYGLS